MLYIGSQSLVKHHFPCTSVCLLVCMSVCVSVCLSVLYIGSQSLVKHPFPLYICLSVCMYLCMCVCLCYIGSQSPVKHPGWWFRELWCSKPGCRRGRSSLRCQTDHSSYELSTWWCRRNAKGQFNLLHWSKSHAKRKMAVNFQASWASQPVGCLFLLIDYNPYQ